MRFGAQGLIEGRRFETFHIDIGWGDPMVEPAEILIMPALLAFAHIPPNQMPCFPLTQQVAEKVHAYTRPHPSGEGSRVKDLVDILLIAGLKQMDGWALGCALRATFDARRTHSLPLRVPDPPSAWSAPFRRLAEETGLGCQTLTEAREAMRRFLVPVLQPDLAGTWDPQTWSWQAPK